MTENELAQLREKFVETECENIQIVNNSLVYNELQDLYSDIVKILDSNKYEYDLSFDFSDDDKEEKLIAILEVYNDKKPSTRKILIEISKVLAQIKDDNYYISYSSDEDYLFVWLNEI